MPSSSPAHAAKRSAGRDGSVEGRRTQRDERNHVDHAEARVDAGVGREVERHRRGGITA